MQLLILSRFAHKAARRMQNPKLPSKLAIEAAQLLSTALRSHGVDDERLYKRTHINHPCRVWVAAGRAHMRWTLKHARACLGVYDQHLKKKDGEHKTWACLRAVEELMQALPASVPETVSAEELASECKNGTWVTATNPPEGCACAVLAIEDGLREQSKRLDDDGNVDAVQTYRAFHQLKHPIEGAEGKCPWLG